MLQHLKRVILNRTPLLVVIVTAMVGLVVWIAPGSNASASAGAVFTVNSTGDGADYTTGDGVCDDGTGKCTLRAAIQQSNASLGVNTIAFDIPADISSIHHHIL